MTPAPPPPPGLLHPRRFRATLLAALAWALLLAPGFTIAYWELAARTALIALVAMLAFGVLERFPPRLPRFVGRWVLQVLAVAASIPFSTLAIYVFLAKTGAPPFWRGGEYLSGWGTLTVTGLLFAPWVAMTALMRQRDAAIRAQAQAFERERGELERTALDARLRLLQAQVAPHFLFNTLANVQALVDTGSAQAAPLLRALVAYLRAAVPRLDEHAVSVEREVELAQAYLALMQMRMPDRLQATLTVDPAALPLRCPPMTLLTLVENAVRHGIDPAEDGGRIEVSVRRRDERCEIAVRDTGLGLGSAGDGLGSGLSSLRERLQLAFGEAGTLRLSEAPPRGVLAEVSFPAQAILPA
jgi:hypothetical protein